MIDCLNKIFVRNSKGRLKKELCIRWLERLKFELTNQNSEGKKKCTLRQSILTGKELQSGII